jgi:tetratricopeptide (TPR) repeat protein
MRLLTPAFLLAFSSHFMGEVSASIVFVATGEPGMVTTRHLSSADLRYDTPADPSPGLEATMIIAREVPRVKPREERVAAVGAASPARVEHESQVAMLCNRGLMQMQMGNFKGALNDLELAMRIDPKAQRAIMLRGVVAARQGNHREALGFYEQAVRVGPESPEVYHSRGLTYMKLDRLDEAIFDFTRAIRLNSHFEEAFLKRGLVYGRRGEFQKSVDDNTSAIRINPNNPVSYNNRAAAFNGLGKKEAAMADVRKSKALERQAKTQQK